MRHPLAGIKVLDFTHGVAGPYATSILGDLGCDVIKVEKPDRGDPTRYMNVSESFTADIPKVGGDYFLSVNRNKRAVTVDLKQEEGRQICLSLAGWADVVLQNFRPGVMKRLRLDYEALKAVNPRLIYGNISAYGMAGPLAEKAGMDVAVQARSGVMRLTGAIGSGEPIRPGVSIADFGGGLFLATGIITALYARSVTGEGEEVNVALLDATMSLLCNYTVACVDGDAELEPMGSGHPQIVPYQALPTSDGHIVIGAGTNKVYRDLCRALGRPDLARDPRFATNQDRVRHRDVLIPILSRLTGERTTAQWLTLLEAADVPCAPVNDLRRALHEPQLRENGMVVRVDHPQIGPIHVSGVPIKFARAVADVRRAPPMLGEHTDEVLTEICGFDPDRLQALRRRGVI